MLRSIGNQSGESVESVAEKKMKAAVVVICITGRFYAWNERVTTWLNTNKADRYASVFVKMCISVKSFNHVHKTPIQQIVVK